MGEIVSMGVALIPENPILTINPITPVLPLPAQRRPGRLREGNSICGQIPPPHRVGLIHHVIYS